MPEKAELQLALADALRLNKSYKKPTHDEANEQAYLSVEFDQIFVSVSGSNDPMDWAQNFSAFRFYPTFHKRIPGTKYKATTGYVNAAENVVAMVEPDLSMNMEIFLSGHSKGGPVAAIAAILLRDKGFKVRGIRTFAAPRFSVQKIRDPLLMRSHQYIAEGDVIPDFPKTSRFRNWQHQGIVHRFGEQVDEHFGVIRDGVQMHLIENYILQLEKEIERVDT